MILVLRKVLQGLNRTRELPELQKIAEGPILDQMRQYAIYYVSK